ncbi:hypothetical protein ACFE04_006988 [Oxalis oulophora]
MEMPQYDFPPPPPPPPSQLNHSGSIGPVIGVVVVIIVLSLIAIAIGRLCSGKRILGYGQFDIEAWMETTFSSCIDGRVTSPPPQQPPATTATESRSDDPLPQRTQTQQEIKQDDQQSP